MLPSGMPMKSTASLAAMHSDSAFGSASSDVFHGHPHDAPRDVERVFARFEHPPEPVERRVGIAVAHRLVERGDQVVVLFTRLVIEQNALLQRVAYDLRL